MPLIPKPTPGGSVAKYVSKASTLGDIADAINRLNSGRAQGSDILGSPQKTLLIRNPTANTLTAGSVVSLTTAVDDPAAEEVEFTLNPSVDIVVPVWNSVMDDLYVLTQDIEPDGIQVFYPGTRYVAVPATFTNATDDRCAFIDPTEPSKVKTTANCGLWPVVGVYEQLDMAIIDTWGTTQRLWRYELTEDWDTDEHATAKLLDLDGTEFAALINLWNPETPTGNGQITGETGYCEQVGEDFVVRESPSSAGASMQFTLDSLTTAVSGPYTGLKVATVTIKTAPCDRAALLGTSAEVVDHSGCVFDHDEADLLGVWGWASEQVADSLDASGVTPCHWAADDRCCVAADSA